MSGRRVASPVVLVLAVDTATPAVTAGVVELTATGARLLAGRVTVDARAHAEVLTPQVLACLAELDATPADLDAVVCGDGPGPYTGLRVGMVTAAALADALGLPAHPVCSLDGLAAEVGHPGELLVVTDARRRELYWARYTAGVRTAGPDVARPADVPTAGAAAVAGPPEHAGPLGLPVVGPAAPGALGLVRCAGPALLAGAAPAPLAPRYLRRPDAVPLVEQGR